jgi:long-chain acyl-CoA synthetase
MTKSIVHKLIDRQAETPTKVAMQFKEGGRWVKYYWKDYYSLVESLGAALIEKTVKKGDCVALVSNTRPEWAVSDLAIMGIGAITIPIYPNNLETDVEFILNDSEAKVLILEDKNQYNKWRNISEKCPHVKHVVLIDNKGVDDINLPKWTEWIQLGREKIKSNESIFTDNAEELLITDTATILYTSGTTGRPKGVVLTHEQIVSEVEDVFSVVTVTNEDMSLTFLPYSHVLGRVEEWGSIQTGYTLAFAENIEKIKHNLKEVSPTFLIAVPRIFEKIYAGILAQSESSKTKAKIFNYCLNIGKEVSRYRQERKQLPIHLSLQLEVAHRLVFNKIHESLGGRMRFAVSGGAPLSADIAQFFHGLGLLICEGYGLTETTAAITFNTPLHYKFGTVGKPIGDVKIKIAEDGEILAKSKKVMKEYYKNKSATDEVFKDNYFMTGDIGHIDSDGYIVITDRKKDLIKTGGGKYVAPQKLENLLKRSPYISNVLIHGDQKKYIVALVTLNSSNLQDFAKRENISFNNYLELTQDPKVYVLIKDVIAQANTELASFETIKKFTIISNDFTVETGEITPSLKVKRRFCDQKFKKEIDELYA